MMKFDIMRYYGSINKNIFKKFLIDADANIGLDLYSIQGRPYSDKIIIDILIESNLDFL